MWKVCLQTETIEESNRNKNNSRIVSTKNAKLSGYYFYTNMNI